MILLYNFIILIYSTSIKLAGLFGNDKAKLWASGRKNWEKKLEESIAKSNSQERFWFHCASLGEFEQGRSLIEKVRREFPDAYILLTFFSPSGYEIRKTYSQVDFVCYLPVDTKRNAEKFIEIVKPSSTFFIKYEFWFHFINELEKKKKSIYIVSAIFRPQQIFFKWYGTFYKNLLTKITRIFIQDKNSEILLTSSNISNYTVVGDTRFDRVKKVADEAKEVSAINDFVGSSRVLVAGSTWPMDEDLVLNIFFSFDDQDIKLIIVPHDVNQERISNIQQKIQNHVHSTGSTLLSEYHSNKNSNILIVDSVGLLSTLYKYGTLTWVGGGFDNGIHNILEPAAHGKPIFFGPNYSKFKEAHDLIAKQSAFNVSDEIAGKRLMLKLLKNESLLNSASKNASEYVERNIGATELIYKFVFNKSNEKRKPGIQQKLDY